MGSDRYQMLQSILIQNYALIKNLEINFSEGFSVITGETGAGKSILLGALGLILGNRADLRALMDKQTKCIVEGQFNIEALSLKSFFELNDLDWEPQTLIRREILPSGKSRAFINDTPVSLVLLKEVGTYLVDIHSQHQGLMLGQADFQLRVLDDFVNKPAIKVLYHELFTRYKQEAKKLEELIKVNEQSRKDEAYFQFQFEELEAAGLDENEYEQLRAREKLLAHAEEVLQAINQANHLLSESDQPITRQMGELKVVLEKVSPYLPKIEEMAGRLNSLLIDLKDMAGEIGMLTEDVSFNPQEMDEVNQRLNTIYKLQHKHVVDSIAELITLREEYSAKLLGIQMNDEAIAKSRKELGLIEEQLSRQATLLTNSRKNATAGFESNLTKVLIKLGMKDGVFQVRIEPLEGFTASGKDKVVFRFTANKGGQVDDITRIASGGELSRLMLALKSLISGAQLFPTVIFDEIDAGVSGEIAGKMGKVIGQLAERHQVIAITHLPQIASKAQHHFKVFKKVADGKTQTLILPLNQEERVEEVAKMMSDEQVTQSALNTAKELLNFDLI